MRNHFFPALPRLDQQKIFGLYGSDVTLIRQMFEEFLRATPQELHELQDSFVAGDAGRFCSLLHKIKPGFDYVGLVTVASAIAKLEHDCRQLPQRLPGTMAFQQLQQMITQSIAAIAEALQTLQPGIPAFA